MTNQPLKLTFVPKKETPGCKVFAEQEKPGEPPKIGSLYIKKYAVPDGTKKVTVTVEFE